MKQVIILCLIGVLYLSCCHNYVSDISNGYSGDGVTTRNRSLSQEVGIDEIKIVIDSDNGYSLLGKSVVEVDRKGNLKIEIINRTNNAIECPERYGDITRVVVYNWNTGVPIMPSQNASGKREGRGYWRGGSKCNCNEKPCEIEKGDSFQYTISISDKIDIENLPKRMLMMRVFIGSEAVSSNEPIYVVVRKESSNRMIEKGKGIEERKGEGVETDNYGALGMELDKWKDIEQEEIKKALISVSNDGVMECDTLWLRDDWPERVLGLTVVQQSVLALIVEMNVITEIIGECCSGSCWSGRVMAEIERVKRGIERSDLDELDKMVLENLWKAATDVICIERDRKLIEEEGVSVEKLKKSRIISGIANIEEFYKEEFALRYPEMIIYMSAGISREGKNSEEEEMAQKERLWFDIREKKDDKGRTEIEGITIRFKKMER